MVQPRLQSSIETVIRNVFDDVLKKAAANYYSAQKNEPSSLLFQQAFLPTEVVKSIYLEHCYSEAFDSLLSDIAVIVISEHFGSCQKHREIRGTIKQGRLRRIYATMNRLISSNGNMKHKPDWDAEVEYILAGRGEEIPVSVVCDIYAESTQTNERIAFELKGPLPNSDQTKVSKEKLLKLYTMTTPQIDAAYFALPYNPYGKREDYDWSFPNRWFNMKQDESVLIGDEFWERIGGVGTYQALLDAVNEISADYKLRIYRDYLGIEPPANLGKGL